MWKRKHERRISREEQLEFLLAIHDASQRMETVIARLLEMSQRETETRPRPHNVAFCASESPVTPVISSCS